MKPTIFYVISFILILLCTSFQVFAIQGSDSTGAVSSYSGTTGAAAASGSSSDSAVSGGRVSAGGSAISSAYSDGTTSGNPGADLSTADATTTPTETTTTPAEETSGSIPSGGGGGGGGGGGPSSEAAEQTTVEAEASQEATDAVAEATTEEAAETISPTENAVTVAIELSEGSSVTLAPQTGAASMSVLAVTATTATIVVTSGTESEGNSITGGVIYSTDQETTMEVGQTIDVDNDGDGVADLQITLSRIDYNTETGKYEGIFTLTYLDPTEEIVSFVKEQIDRGEVAFVKGPSEEEISFAYWIWIIVACIVMGVLALVGWVLFDKKNKKHFPTTIPTHYFEKLMRQEVSTHKKPEQQRETTKIEVKKENNLGKEQSIGTQTIISELKKSKKKKGKRKKNKKAAGIKKKKKAKNKRLSKIIAR